MSIAHPTQQERVLDYMLNRGWLTLAEISAFMHAQGKDIPGPSVSARLRQFKTWQGGKYQMEARRPERQGWQWRYRLTEPRPVQQELC